MNCYICGLPLRNSGRAHEACRRLPIPDETERNREIGKQKREMTAHLIESICQSDIALFRANGPIEKK